MSDKTVADDRRIECCHAVMSQTETPWMYSCDECGITMAAYISERAAVDAETSAETEEG
jgi:hypothetical protein